MPRFTERLARLEGRRLAPGALPMVLIAPDGPDGDAVRQQAQRLRERGQQVLVIGPDADALGALVEACSP